MGLSMLKKKHWPGGAAAPSCARPGSSSQCVVFGFNMERGGHALVKVQVLSLSCAFFF